VICDRSVVFSGYSGFLHNKTDSHNIIEILLKMALNTITLTLTQTYIAAESCTGNVSHNKIHLPSCSQSFLFYIEKLAFLELS
jgi:hypothetical protein